MLAPGNYVQWKSRIKRYIETKPNHELIHYCLTNPPYELGLIDKEIPISEGSPITRFERFQETSKNVLPEIRDQLNAKAEAVQIILTGIDNDIYSTVDACPNACEMWKAMKEPSMVAEDDETLQDKEIDKLMALISLSFKKIYKPTNNNLQTSSNTNRENQDNSPRINRSVGYENQRIEFQQLFPTMVVQSQLSEGLAIPTDPQHTPTLLQSSSSQPQTTQKHRKPKRKVTEVPQPSDSMENVADKVVYMQLNDSLVRVATTASSLEVEQDSVNINKTQSKATPNESSSQGIILGNGPRCQDTMWDTIAQTRSERVSKLSNDSLLGRGDTLQSDEDSMKLNELMKLCTTLQSRVLDLEQTKTTQANENDSLKRRLKKLKKKKRLRTHKLKRLYKGRISAIDANEGITLVSTHDDAKMFDVDKDLGGEEVFVAKQDENVVEKEVDAAQAKAKGIVFHEPEESKTTTPTKPKPKSQDEGKAIMIEQRVKLKKKDQIMLDEEVALKLQAELQAEFDKEQRLAREKAQQEEEANITLIET
uniref:Uncharacterized protein n=1 Tax=Tanacetum cinerariifolium TaxID=118510 RepID=A0A6L2K0S0_TANCI|nr:hypothetical protein [Tanacetum cinerariifolium]